MKRSPVITLAFCAATSILFAESDKTPPSQKPYSENSVIVKKTSTPIAKTKAAYVTDKTASEGMATFQTGKGSGWGVRWLSRDFAPKLKPNVEYVFKMRLRPEFENAPDSDGFFLTLGFYNPVRKTGRGSFKAYYQAYDEGKYRNAYLFRTKVRKPAELPGFFYCTPNEKAADGAFKVWYDHIEFIPVEDFKDKALLKRLPLFELF